MPIVELTPTISRFITTYQTGGGNINTYDASAKANDDGVAPYLSQSWEDGGNTSVLNPKLGQEYLHPSVEYANGVYLVSYNLSAYKLTDILKLTLKFDTKTYYTSNGDPAYMQTRVFRKYYFYEYYAGSQWGLQSFKAASWPNPDAADAYYLLDEVELPDSDRDSGGPNYNTQFTHEIDVPVDAAYFDTEKQIWLFFTEKDHFDLVDPETLRAGKDFYYKSAAFKTAPILEVITANYYTATINAAADVEAEQTPLTAEPALIFSEPMVRSIYFDSNTVGYSQHQGVKGVGAANYLTPVVPSKRLVPRSNLSPSQKEAI